MGFVSAGQAGEIYFWDLIQIAEEGSGQGATQDDDDLMLKQVCVTSVVNIPGRKNEVFCVGSDKKIWNSKQEKNPTDVPDTIA